MQSSFIRRQLSRETNRSKIEAILQNNPLKISSIYGILIGSRAARYWLPNFRRASNDNDTDWDIICSSQFLLDWLQKNNAEIDHIKMIIPKSNEDDLLDLYIYCTLKDTSKYDFIIPRSSTSYTAYLLDNLEQWTIETFMYKWMEDEKKPVQNGSAKLLLILKKLMLYYKHQWIKTAQDYRQLLTITDPLTDNDTILCNLFVRYNEKVHGPRPSDAYQFIIHSSDTQKDIIINRDNFFQQSKDKQLLVAYQTAWSMAVSGDILAGLEHICTQGPLWLADFVINHWLDIQNERFTQKIELTKPSIEFKLDNYRLFPDIPELALQKIVCNITDIVDFYSMQLVCRRWYSILNEDLFWRDLYVFHYGKISVDIDDVRCWKIMYFVRLQEQSRHDHKQLQDLVNSSLQLRQITVTNIVRLWEELTHECQPIEPALMSKLTYILSNAFYYHMENTSDVYLAKLTLIGLDNTCSRSDVNIALRIREYESSRFADHIEELSVGLRSSNNQCRSLRVLGINLLGFHICKYGHYPVLDQTPAPTSSTLCTQFPSELLVCLFIMMAHPAYRAHFIEYLKNLERHCKRSFHPWVTV